MKRKVLTSKAQGGGSYFAAPKSSLSFIGSGCKTLDLALGGGWAEQRIFNVVGDKSTGKTLLMIEACANFARKYPKGKIRYAECEAAFDPQYAAALGMPVDRVDFGKALETVEDMFEELNEIVAKAKVPTLYILDSLDALSDRAEMGRDLDEGSYGANKAKAMSQLFRRLTGKLARSNVTLGIVSQIRDKIGISFGRKTTRSGGHALDFYASQVLYLAHLGTEQRTIKGIKRPASIKVRGKVDKNKVGLPFREAQFEIFFGYGVDDYKACLDWLNEVKSLKLTGVAKTDITTEARRMMRADPAEFAEKIARLHKLVEDRWYEIETSFMPTRKKYV